MFTLYAVSQMRIRRLLNCVDVHSARAYFPSIGGPHFLEVAFHVALPVTFLLDFAPQIPVH